MLCEVRGGEFSEAKSPYLSPAEPLRMVTCMSALASCHSNKIPDEGSLGRSWSVLLMVLEVGQRGAGSSEGWEWSLSTRVRRVRLV